jgi:hypothetical protein
MVDSFSVSAVLRRGGVGGPALPQAMVWNASSVPPASLSEVLSSSSIDSESSSESSSESLTGALPSSSDSKRPFRSRTSLARCRSRSSSVMAMSLGAPSG